MNSNSRTNIDWNALKMEYACDPTITAYALAKKHNVSLATLKYHFSRYLWNDARTAYQEKLNHRMVDLAATKGAVAMLRDINTKQLKWNEEMRYVINSLLKVRGPDGSVIMRSTITLNDVGRAIAAYAELYRLDRLALGASTENVQPATTRDRIDEMTDAQVIEELERVRARISVN